MSGKKPLNKSSDGRQPRLSRHSSSSAIKKTSNRFSDDRVEHGSRFSKIYSGINRKQPSLGDGKMNNSNGDNKTRAYLSRRRSSYSTKATAGQDTRQIRSKGILNSLDITFGGRLYIWLATIVIVIILGATLWAFTRKNAYEVYLNNKVIGVIQMSKKISESAIYDTAVKKLASDIGANVQVHETVTFKGKHASKKDFVTVEYITGEIYKRFTYDIEASGISVNGNIVGYVKSAAEANDLLDSIKSEYIRPESSSSAEFIEDVRIIPEFVPSEQVSASNDIKSILMSTVDEQQPYKVKSGDTLWKIAQNAGMTVDQLLQINPTLTSNSVIRVDQELSIIRQRPMVSVKTVEEVTHIEVERYQRETQQNNNERRSYSRVIQQGKDGQKEVVSAITRINGFEIENGREIVRETVTVEPITEIIEVGTR